MTPGVAGGAAPGALVEIHVGKVKIKETAIATPQEGGLNIFSRGRIAISTSNFNFGDIFLLSNDSIIVDHSVLAAVAPVDGGNITFIAPNLLLIDNSNLTAQAGVLGGQVQLDSDRVIIGDGNVTGLASGALVRTVINLENPDALFLASDSQIDTRKQEMDPDVDIAAETLIFFPELRLPYARDFLLEVCGTELLDDMSSFIVTGRGGLPIQPGWWIPSLELTSPLPLPETPAPLRR